MRITKEDFYKLPQLDRIEYRQRMADLPETGVAVLAFWLNVGLFAFLLLMMPQWYGAFGEGSFINLVQKIIPIFRLSIALLVVGIFIDLIILLQRKRKQQEIEEYYFKIISKQNDTKK